MNKKLLACFALFILAFSYIIIHSLGTGYEFYVADALVSIAIISVCFIFFRGLHLSFLSFVLVGTALLLHNLGAFGFYAHPPVPWEWDLTTHVFGFIAASAWIFNLLKDLARPEAVKTAWFFFGVIFITMGIGVVIEFLEFGGYAATGFQEGFLGRGPGDIQGDWISGDYWDTIVDLWYNLIGAVIGFILAYATIPHSDSKD